MVILKKYKFLLFIPLILLIILSIIYYNQNDKTIEEVLPEPFEITTMVDQVKAEPNKIKIDIKGAVKNPGVYEMLENSRVIDAINISGGFNYNADTSTINLSKILNDENVIIVYTKDDIEKFRQGNVVIQYIEKECECKDEVNAACISKENIATNIDTNIATNIDTSEPTNQLINLNTASKEKLTTLPSIGESKADLIIEYRNKNKFKTIDELKNIKGIGESIYNKIKDLIEV